GRPAPRRRGSRARPGTRPPGSPRARRAHAARRLRSGPSVAPRRLLVAARYEWIERHRLAVAENLVQRLPVLDALQAGRPKLPVFHETTNLLERLLTRDDMRVEGPWHALDAGGRDHRAADHDQLAAYRGADRAGHDAARADPDADIERRQTGLRPARAELLDRGDHVDRRGHGAHRRVLGAFGHAEERHDLVADQLLHRALVSEDDLDHLREVVVEQADDRGRRGVLGETRETADVGEQDRGLAPVPR